MIDERFQKKGYGKVAILLSIEYLTKEFGVNEIFLSFAPDNMIAEKLYSGVGFKRTGDLEKDEIVMRLDISRE